MNDLLTRSYRRMHARDYSATLTLLKPNTPFDPLFHNPKNPKEVEPISNHIPLQGMQPWSWCISFSDFWTVGILFDKCYMYEAFQLIMQRQVAVEDWHTIREELSKSERVLIQQLAFECWLHHAQQFVIHFSDVFRLWQRHPLIQRIIVESDDISTDIGSQCIFQKPLKTAIQRDRMQILQLAKRKPYNLCANELVSYFEHYDAQPMSKFDLSHLIKSTQ